MQHGKKLMVLAVRVVIALWHTLRLKYRLFVPRSIVIKALREIDPEERLPENVANCHVEQTFPWAQTFAGT